MKDIEACLCCHARPAMQGGGTYWDMHLSQKGLRTSGQPQPCKGQQINVNKNICIYYTESLLYMYVTVFQ